MKIVSSLALCLGLALALTTATAAADEPVTVKDKAVEETLLDDIGRSI
jgi:hypothetical protein